MERDVPIGSIASFAGSILDIPSTYRLCDGTHGTPDLRNKFIVGSGDTYTVDSKGGSINHVHDLTGFGHDHVIGGSGDTKIGAGYDFRIAVAPTVGTTNTKDGRPPFYSLAYVMYVGRPI